MSRTKKALLIFATRMLNMVVNFITFFFLTPIILSGIGKELYGAYQIIQKLINVIAIGNFQPMSLLKLTLANAQSDGSYELKRSQVGAAILVWLATLPFVAAIGLAVYLNSDLLINVPGEFTLEVRAAVLVAVLVVIITPLVSLPGTVLKGLNLEYLPSSLQFIAILSSAYLVYIVVRYSLDLKYLVAAYASQALIMMFIGVFFVWRRIPWFGISRPTKLQFQRFFSLNIWTFLSTLLNQAFVAGDIILISVFMGTEYVAVYTLTRSAMMQLSTPAIDLAYSGMPGMGDLFGRNEYKKVFELRNEMMRVVLFFTMIIGSIFICLNKEFVGLWVGLDSYGGEILTTAIAGMIIVDSIYKLEILCLDAAVDLRIKAIGQFFGVIVFLVLGTASIGEIGIIALPFALMAGQFCSILIFWTANKKMYSSGIRLAFSSIVRPLVFGLSFWGVMYFITKDLGAESWHLLVLQAMALGASFALCGWFVILSDANRKALKQRISSAIAR